MRCASCDDPPAVVTFEPVHHQRRRLGARSAARLVENAHEPRRSIPGEPAVLGQLTTLKRECLTVPPSTRPQSTRARLAAVGCSAQDHLCGEHMPLHCRVRSPNASETLLECRERHTARPSRYCGCVWPPFVGPRRLIGDVVHLDRRVRVSVHRGPGRDDMDGVCRAAHPPSEDLSGCVHLATTMSGHARARAALG